jgi:glycosyltransferase involved in cell wall biosynthesis
MHYRPNADAALRLGRDVLPLVRREVPHAELLLVGRDPSAELIALGMEPGVVVTGLVEDVRPFLDQATVFAAPLRWASGIQNKILEAMAMELPVVTSTAAADGLRPESGGAPPLVVADDAASMAAALVRYLRNEERAPCEEARRFVEQHFSWRTHALRVEVILESAVAGARASSRRVREVARLSS